MGARNASCSAVIELIQKKNPAKTSRIFYLDSYYFTIQSLLRFSKYNFDRSTTFGASTRVVNIVGIAIKAKKVSITLIIKLSEVVAPSRILPI